MEFSINSEEREFLLELLEERQREMLREISRSHHRQFRQSLKRNEQILEGVIVRLRSLQPHDQLDRVA
jgi:hypothetical protein